MILLITNNAFDLCKFIQMSGTGISQTVVGNKNCLLIHTDKSGKSSSDFKAVFNKLGLEESQPSENYKQIKEQIPYIVGKGTTVPEYIDLRKEFDETNIHMVANLIEQLFDGYSVENNMELLKSTFESYFKARV